MSKRCKYLAIISMVVGSEAYAQDKLQDTISKDSVRNMHLNAVHIYNKYYKRYNYSEISSDLRLQTNLLETPQNIQIIHADVLQDQMAFNLNESVTRNVSGTMREELHNGISPDIYSRGGYINAQRNGVDLRPIIKGPLGDDASIIENIEFVKGPAGFMNAVSDPAGSYNIITKKPTGDTRQVVKLSYGSFRTMRAEADLQGVLDSTKKWWYRINLMGMNTKGFMRFDDQERMLVAPAITYRPNQKTSVTLELIYQRLNYMMLSEAQISPYGFGTLPTNFSLSDPSMRPYRANDYNAFLTVDHRFNDRWKLTTRISNVNNDYKGTIFWVNGKNATDPDILDRYLVYDAMRYNTFSAQAYVQGKYRTGNVSHTLVGGIDFNNKFNEGTDTWNTASRIYPLRISDPQYSDVISLNAEGGTFASENEIHGVDNKTEGRLHYTSAYAMNESALWSGKIKLNVGLRLTQSYGKFDQYGDKTKGDDLVLTPRVGFSYLPIESLNFYGLYDRSFLPQAGVLYDGSARKPLKGTSYELGLKKDWFDGAWYTTVSVYQIDRNHILTTDPVSNQSYQTGENRSKGVEFDLKGRLAKGLQAIVNYAYTDSKITEDDKNPEMVGAPTPNRVKHIQNTWLTYYLPENIVDGLNVAVGYQYLAGRTERFSRAGEEKLKDIMKWDAGIGFTRKKWGIQIMANNLLNKKIYSTAWKRNDMYYWVQQAQRQIRCSLTINL